VAPVIGQGIRDGAGSSAGRAGAGTLPFPIRYGGTTLGQRRR